MRNNLLKKRGLTLSKQDDLGENKIYIPRAGRGSECWVKDLTEGAVL